jgi:long-chain acyl-CoA synthetase
LPNLGLAILKDGFCLFDERGYLKMTVKRVTKPTMPLAEMDVFKGRNLKLDFESMPELFLVRSKELADQEFVTYYDQMITYAQMNERANRVANYLKTKGVKKGDVVSSMVLNSPEVYYNMFGSQKLGCIAGTINFMLKAPEIAHVLDDSKPKVAFVSSEYMVEFAKGLEMAKTKPIVVEVVTKVKHDVKIAETTMADILAKYPADEAIVEISREDPFMLLYSSGTTGRPKGILLANKSEMAICKAKTSFLSQPDDKYIIFLPMFHTNPLCCWTYPMIFQGLKICIREKFSPTDFWPSVLDNGITLIQGVPTMYHYVFNSIDPDSVDRSKLKLSYAFSGAAPLPPELIRGFKDRFNVTLCEGYGLTECTGFSTSNLGVTAKPGSIGIQADGQQIEIMDGKNNILPVGEKGEICIKSEANMMCYYNNPEATAETLIDGWLHTGDMGYMDEEGYFFISGRLKEMINRGGENIYPREIELALEDNPKISAVAVVGVPDPALGERIKACVILKEPGSLTAEEIKDYLKDRIAKYKLPEYVEFMTEFPMNATGKITKNELKYVPKSA